MTRIASATAQPVKGNGDLFAFQLGFVPEGKAVEGETPSVVTELDDGDLIIEGYAAIFEGEDREGENFVPEAFDRGTKAFLESNSPTLAYHHDHKQVLGRVLDLQRDGKGLRMKARVDGALRKSPTLATVYEQVKKGTLNALSIGGFFRRGLVEGKQRIVDMDFTDISVTGVPVHTGPSFNVVAGKALSSDITELDKPDGEFELRASDLDQLNFLIEEANRVINTVVEAVQKRSTPTITDPAPAAA